MKKLFLIIPFFILFIGCTTVQQTTKPYDEVYTTEQPQQEVKLNVEAYTNPTPTPYTNIYIDLDPFDWHWGSYYYYPTYYYSWYYYPSVWTPYWYYWYPIEPYYDNHNYYYGHRNGYNPNLPPPKQPVEPRNPRVEPVLTKPVYSKPTMQSPTVKQPEMKYGEPRKTNVKTYTSPTYTQPRSRNEYVSPSSKTYVPRDYPQQRTTQPKTYYQPQQKSPYQSQPRSVAPTKVAPSNRGGR
jgi:hypothetical protein